MIKHIRSKKSIRIVPSNEEFIRQEKKLTSTLLETIQERKVNDLLVKLGWLYDQWAIQKYDMQKKKLQKIAKKYFRRALQRQPRHPSALNGLGTVYLHENNFEEALRCYKKAHTYRPSCTSYNALGNVYRQMNNFIFAEKCYKRALRYARSPLFKKAVLYNLNMLKRDIRHDVL
jgi:tetratricopeptide (TPR) repeat protein